MTFIGPRPDTPIGCIILVLFIIFSKDKYMKVFLHYPKCSTCQKAKKWLDANHISYEERHIVEENPTYEELKQWYENGDLPLKKFFNTSIGCT